MSLSVWYISKYLTLPEQRVGGRSFMLLREFARAGHRPVAFTSDANHLVAGPAISGRSLHRSVDGVDVYWVRTRRYRKARSLGRVLSWLDFEWGLWRLPKKNLVPPDVVIASSLSILSIFNGFRISRRYNCPLIFEVRDIWPLTLVEEGGLSRHNPVVRLLAAIERFAYRRSDAIVGTRPKLAEHVHDVAGPRAAPTYCIPMGVSGGDTAGDKLDPVYVSRYLPRQGKFLICHAGTIGATNALETLLSCARQMRDRDDIHFVIVGEGDLKERYQELCADLSNITFAPAVPKSQVQDLLAQCDLLYFSVHPSDVWRYGQSLNKVIDYMLAGKPVVASYTGYPSMIDEAGSGVFVPSGDVDALISEIERYFSMPSAERNKQGAAGRKWLLENRRYPDLASNYIEIITAARGAGAAAPR